MTTSTPYSLSASDFHDGATLYYYDHDSVNPDDASSTILQMTLVPNTSGWDAVHGEFTLHIPYDDVTRLVAHTDTECRTLFCDYEEALAHKLHREANRIERIQQKTPQELLEPLYVIWKSETNLSRHERRAYEDALKAAFDFTPRP